MLERCYTAGVVCAPSRAAFLTGKRRFIRAFASTTKTCRPTEVTIAEALKPLGYRTALFGKWHRGRPRSGQNESVHPIDQGFDEFFGYTDADHAWEKFPTKLWEGRREVAVTGYIDDLITDRGVDFARQNSGRPFFLYLAYVATHFHVAAPDDEVALHKGKFVEADPEVPLKATYAAMVTRLDRNIGRLMETIKQLDRSRETLDRVHERPRCDVRERQRRHECGPGQQPSVPRPEADVVGGGRSRAGPGLVAGTHSGGRQPGKRSCSSSTCCRRSWRPPAGRLILRWHVDGINLLDVWTGKSAATGANAFSGNGRASGPTRSRRCAGSSSWWSPEAASPSCTTWSATPPSAAMFRLSTRS